MDDVIGEETMKCPECDGDMKKDGAMMKCEQCGYAMPAEGEDGETDYSADDTETL